MFIPCHIFVSRDTDGRIVFIPSLSNIQYSWKMRMLENMFDIGWQDCARQVFGIGKHISAANFHNSTCAPANLQTVLASNNPDRDIWDKSYNEEYDGHENFNMFTEITTEQYKGYLEKYGDKARFIPTMNLFSIKQDMDGNPNRTKFCIIAIGSLKCILHFIILY